MSGSKRDVQESSDLAPPAKRQKAEAIPDMEKDVVVNGCSLKYYIRESEGASAKHTILFLHGWCSSHECWESVRNKLRGDVRSVAVDHRGCGNSAAVGTPEENTIAQIRDDTIAFIEAVLKDHIPVTLCGISLGAAVCSEVIAHRGDLVDRVIMIASAPFDGLGNKVRESYLSDQLELRRKAKESGDTSALLSGKLDHRVPNPDALRRATETNLKCSDEHFIGLFNSLKTWSIPEYMTSKERKHHVLIMVGDSDILSPFQIRDYLTCPKDTTGLQVFVRVGHGVCREIPDEVVTVLEDYLEHGIQRMPQP